ncbi:hypothetical protein [Galactobacter caseinivorans]|uniref:hypothetical protein n=1 Tax=Galactobacter caseinivorans TaxID=2676123 RepID=UPI0011C3E193|nr:hypothetical protein [Galactobacter caseinivorans]
MFAINRKLTALATAGLLAASLQCVALAPASAAPVMAPNAEVAAAAARPSVAVSAVRDKKGSQLYFLYKLKNATAKKNSNGTLTIRNSAGKSMGTAAISDYNSKLKQRITVRYVVASGGKSFKAYVTKMPVYGRHDPRPVEVDPLGSSSALVAPTADSGCALSNLLWGLGGGAVSGIPGGPFGIAGGMVFGAMWSGIQSANTC